MQLSQMFFLASFATAALAAPVSKCSTAPPTTPVMPSTGSTDLPAPASGLTLKYIAVGHGLQNYTCASANTTAVNVGALAVLYDATALYSSLAYANLSSNILWNQAIPLNLINQSAAEPAGSNAAVVLDETAYQANVSDPFPADPVALSLRSTVDAVEDDVSAPFLGHHYFDTQGSPTFDLSASPDRLVLSGTKTGDVKAPETADKGVLGTGAVDWLQVGNNGRGLSLGLSFVYRIVTAGGAAEACSVSGANPVGSVFSVPYVAQYWFYG